jgi:phage shock protein PspC (stress-responsive transcriptional regulator)
MVIMQKRLTRRPSSGRIAGVCAGLAHYFDVDVTLVRLAWVVLSIVPGGIIGGVIAYAVAWAIVPPADGLESATSSRRLRRSATNVRIAGVCAGIAEYFDVDPTIVRLVWALLTIAPGAIVLGVFAYVIAWLVMPQATAPPLQPMASSVV